jgi:hypothetical protein
MKALPRYDDTAQAAAASRTIVRSFFMIFLFPVWSVKNKRPPTSWLHQHEAKQCRDDGDGQGCHVEAEVKCTSTFDSHKDEVFKNGSAGRPSSFTH